MAGPAGGLWRTLPGVCSEEAGLSGSPSDVRLDGEGPKISMPWPHEKNHLQDFFFLNILSFYSGYSTKLIEKVTGVGGVNATIVWKKTMSLH